MNKNDKTQRIVEEKSVRERPRVRTLMLIFSRENFLDHHPNYEARRRQDRKRALNDHPHVGHLDFENSHASS